MALIPVNPTRKVVGKKGRKSGGGLGAALGTVAGGAIGALTANPGAVLAGASAGAALGGTVGGIAGERIQPAKDNTQVEAFNPQVAITASDEALRGQQLLEGVQAANRTPGMAEFTAPLTKGYIQSMINLKKMG